MSAAIAPAEEPEITEMPEKTEPDKVSAGREFTIDELAAETRVPSRTIRFYQSKKALPAPERRGRKAIYNESHAERLRLIAKLQDQGLTIKAIRDVLSRADKGELALGDWLGLKDQLQAPWAEDRSVVVSGAELLEMVGDDRDGLVADLVRLRLVKRTGDAFTVPSPGLLRVARQLEAAGFDLETGADAARLLRKHLGRAATDLSKHFVDNLRHADPGTDASQAFEALRPVSMEAVRLIFAHEMERALRELVQSGRATDAVRRS